MQNISEMFDVKSFFYRLCITYDLNSQKTKEKYTVYAGYQTQDLSHAQNQLATQKPASKTVIYAPPVTSFTHNI